MSVSPDPEPASNDPSGNTTPTRDDRKNHPVTELLVTKRFRVVRVAEDCRDGSVRSREIVEHPGSVVIVPLLPNHQLCLIRNARKAVGTTL